MKLKSNSMTTGSSALLCLVLSAAIQAAEPPAPAANDKTTAPVPSAAPARAEPKLSTTAQPRANTSEVRAPASSTAQAQAAPKTPPAARKTNDRIELDTTVVTGNRELPKVLYIVPWKKADIGDLPAQPFNTLLDEVLTPVDRDVFRREVTYYGAIANGTGAASGEAAAPAGSSRSSEK
jgi:hypothetical protein